MTISKTTFDYYRTKLNGIKYRYLDEQRDENPNPDIKSLTEEQEVFLAALEFMNYYGREVENDEVIKGNLRDTARCIDWMIKPPQDANTVSYEYHLTIQVLGYFNSKYTKMKKLK